MLSNPLDKTKTYQLRNELIEKIEKYKPNYTKEELQTWSVRALKNHYVYLKDLVFKTKTLEELQLYGDSITNTNESVTDLKKKVGFVRLHAIKDINQERYTLIKNINTLISNNSIQNVSYKHLMTETITQLELRLQFLIRKSKKKDMVKKLVDLGYKKNYVKKLSIEELQHIQNDPTPYNKTQRQQMKHMLMDKHSWAKTTVNGWNTDKMKDAFKKNMIKKYSPLAESMPKRINNEKQKNFNYVRRGMSRMEYLSDLSEILYFDIIDGKYT